MGGFWDATRLSSTTRHGSKAERVAPVADLRTPGRSGILAAMPLSFLDFEQPIAELEAKIDELKFVSSDAEVNIGEEIARLRAKSRALTTSIFANLSPWQVAQLARHHRGRDPLVEAEQVQRRAESPRPPRESGRRMMRVAHRADATARSADLERQTGCTTGRAAST